jgi:uncharacterized SAM-binding protein YcdF (DUF218 family)
MKLISLIRKPRFSKFIISLIIGLLFVQISVISLRIAIASYSAPQPQAILVLGGEVSRMEWAVKLMKQYPKMKVWVSDPKSFYQVNSQVFKNAGMDQSRIIYDFCATDTVTNFTCNVQDFQQRGIHHLFVVTSDYHMARSRTIATLVLGSNGIIVTPVSVPSSGIQPDSPIKIVRDAFRSLLWLSVRRTGASFNPRLHP